MVGLQSPFWLALRGAALALSLVAPPGPVNVAQLTLGLTRGWKPSLTLGLGATAAETAYAALAAVGAGHLAGLAWLRAALWAGGALLLIGFGAATLRGARAPFRPVALGGGHPFLAGCGLGLLNPMAPVLLAVLVAERSLVGCSTCAGFWVAGLAAGASAWNVALAAVAASGARWLSPRAFRWIGVAAGAALVAYGVVFAAAGVRLVGGL